MEITSPNNDKGYVDPTTGRAVPDGDHQANVNRIKFHEVIYNSLPEERKPGFFSRVLRALGGFAPLAYLAAPFTGGLSLIAGAGLQSMGAIGAKSQANHYAEENARLSKQPPATVSYPGMMSASLASDPALSLMSARDASMTNAIQSY
jgi:hypothetical protein